MRDVRAMLERRSVIAVVGASDNRHKFGAAIYRDLKSKGFDVRAVNPNRATVDGDPAYPDLASIDGPVDVVDLVVQPEVSETIVEDMRRLQLDTVWFQPGSESAVAVEAARAAGMTVVTRACIMTETRALEE